MLTKLQAVALRMAIESYAEAYEESQNAGRLMPADAELARAEYRASKGELEALIKALTKGSK